MRRCARLLLIALSWLVIVPAAAYAQASITGIVKDSSGAVLPGVSVEASSPVLIEKSRSAVTDSTGQYRILELRAGTYTVTFTLTGFSVVKREDLELTGNFTATLNAEMKVGGVSETVTVSGESPIVDVTSANRQTTVDSQTLNDIPSARGYAAMALLIPAIIVQGGGTTDVQATPGMVIFGGAGGRGNEGRLQLDGLNVGASLNGGGVSGYNADVTNAQEISISTSGGLGETEVGGPTMNVVPKTGGNTFKGTFFASGTPGSLVGSNYTPALKAAGLAVPGQYLKIWDVNQGVGGPIKKDRMWFFADARDEGQHRSVPGLFPNINAGDPTKWLFVPDLTKQGESANSTQIGNARITMQITPRNKLNVFWDDQHPCSNGAWSNNAGGCRGLTSSGALYGGGPFFGSNQEPEAAGYQAAYQRVQQATWQSPATSRLLLEAGVGTYLSRWGSYGRPGSPVDNLIPVSEQCQGGVCPNNGGQGGVNYRAPNNFNDWIGTHTWRASASYVTGGHNMKIGYNGAYLVDDQKNFTSTENGGNISYTFNNGVPNQVSETLLPVGLHQRVEYNSFYAQDQWTFGHFTLQGAARYDHTWSFYPDQQVGPTRFQPTALFFPQSTGVKYDDISPRMGAAWDVFGDGKTSVKVNLGRYMEPASNGNGNYTITNPVTRIVGSGSLGVTPANRSWSDANGNFIPDCNLSNPQANGECGTISNLNFGRSTNANPLFTNNFDPNLLSGWGVRPNDWSFGLTVQREIIPRVSVEVGYFRRWLDNFTGERNSLVTQSNFVPYSIAPVVDPRLGSDSGRTITGIYTVSPALANQASNLIFPTSSYGNQYQHYNGFLVNVSARTHNGFTFQGGVNSGKTVQDNCAIRSQFPDLNVPGFDVSSGPPVNSLNPYCHIDTGFLTRVTGFGSYLIPKVDVQFSGTFRSDPGQQLQANEFVFSPGAFGPGNQFLASSTGFFNSNQFAFVPLLTPGSMYGDRINEIDLSVAKILKFGRTRTRVGIDVYNVMNSSAVLAYNLGYAAPGTTGAGAWLAPQQVLTGRYGKLSVQFDF
jgi:hypothetical protein